MACTVGPDVVTDGLVFCLDAANSQSYPGSGETWYDISGNNVNATKAGSVGPIWYSEGYFEFTGGTTGDNYTRFEIASPAMTDMTVDVFYLRMTGGETVFRMTNDDYHIRLDRVSAGNVFNDYAIYPTTDNGVDTWVHNAMTWQNNQDLSFYKNGVLDTSGSRGSPDTDGIAAGTLRIGTRSDAHTEHFIGYISCFKLYNRTLTPDEIARNFEAVRGRYGI